MTALNTCVIISKKVKSSNTLKKASSYPIQGHGGVGGYPRYDGTRGIVHPGHVSSLTQRQTDIHALWFATKPPCRTFKKLF